MNDRRSGAHVFRIGGGSARREMERMMAKRKMESVRTLEDLRPEDLRHRDSHEWKFTGDTLYDPNGKLMSRARVKKLGTSAIGSWTRRYECSCGSWVERTFSASSGEVVSIKRHVPKSYQTSGIGRTRRADARRVYLEREYSVGR